MNENLNIINIVYDKYKPDLIIENNNIIKIDDKYQIINKYFKSEIKFEYVEYNNFNYDKNVEMIIFYFSDNEIYLSNDFKIIIDKIKESNEEVSILVTFNDKFFKPDLEKYFEISENIIEISSLNDFYDNLKENILNKIWKFKLEKENNKINPNTIINKIDKSKLFEIKKNNNKEDNNDKNINNDKEVDNNKENDLSNENELNDEKFLDLFNNFLTFKESSKNFSHEERKEKATKLFLELADGFDI